MVTERWWSSHGDSNFSFMPIAGPKQPFMSLRLETYSGGLFLSVEAKLDTHLHGKSEKRPMDGKVTYELTILSRDGISLDPHGRRWMT